MSVQLNMHSLLLIRIWRVTIVDLDLTRDTCAGSQ